MNCGNDIEKKIACVIVTYNRKQLLKRCLDAVACQSLKPTTVYITDNASTDGTIDCVKEWGYYNCEKDGVQYKYILNDKNEGGAGGFYLGMKAAFEDNAYDGIWVMDDDGVPESNCLMNLLPYLSQFHYIAPIVLSDDDFQSCSFAPHHENIKEFAEMKGESDGIIKNWASPFNGVLYSCELISKVGFPKREMFIWGDESNYHFRAINKGFIPYTIIQAIHYHPINRQEYETYQGTGVISNINSDWKLYCYLRNNIYNKLRVETYFPKNVYRAFRTSIADLIYYHRKGYSFTLILSAILAGVFGYFGGLEKIMQH